MATPTVSTTKPTAKLIAKTVARPAVKAQAQTQTPPPKPAMSTTAFNATVAELNQDHGPAYINFQKDLAFGRMKLDECTRIFGLKINPFCKDTYKFDPKNLTFKGVNEYLGLEPGALGKLGLLKGVGGTPEKAQPLFTMTFPKEYLDGVMESHRIIAELPR